MWVNDFWSWMMYVGFIVPLFMFEIFLVKYLLWFSLRAPSFSGLFGFEDMKSMWVLSTANPC